MLEFLDHQEIQETQEKKVLQAQSVPTQVIQDRKERKVYLGTLDPKVCQDFQVFQDLLVQREKREIKDFQSRGLQVSQGSKETRGFQELQVHQVLVSRDGQGHQAPQGCRAPRGTGGLVSQGSRVQQDLREKMALWGHKGTLDFKVQMELLELQDKMGLRDLKVAVVRMVCLVLLVLLEHAHLENQVLKENRGPLVL